MISLKVFHCIGEYVCGKQHILKTLVNWGTTYTRCGCILWNGALSLVALALCSDQSRYSRLASNSICKQRTGSCASLHKRLVNEIRDCFVHGRALLEKQKSIQKQYNYFNNITKVDVIKVILTGLFFRHGYLFLLFTF